MFARHGSALTGVNHSLLLDYPIAHVRNGARGYCMTI